MIAEYLVGIDLGTTNSVVAFQRNQAGENSVEILSIPQLMPDGSVRDYSSLPSSIYLLAQDELEKIEGRLPWSRDLPEHLIGHGALEAGQRRSSQLVQSAKSWLSHRQVDRQAGILPWGSDFSRKLSPLNASALVLKHIVSAWDNQFPGAPLAKQSVALTLPASFDEEARALTLKAAQEAGLADLYLLEEPQAASYQWISNPSHLAQLADKKMMLVVDVGGGTSDFSLVSLKQVNGKQALSRVAVGDHLLLGGDNLDQALAYQLDPQQVSSLSSSRLAALVQQTRRAKERLLSVDAPESMSLTVLGGGRKLIGGSQKFTVERSLLHEQVQQGFFPEVELSEPVQKTGYGVQTLGLPYEKDAAISRHLASFLRAHEQQIRAACGEGQSIPDVVLFNGGVFNSDMLRQRVLHQLSIWRGEPLFECLSSEPDLAVARGACVYLKALFHGNTRIESGVPHSLFLQTADDALICVLPKDTAKGEKQNLAQTFSVKLGQTVRFPLFRASDSLNCETGELRPLSDELDFVSYLMTELDSQENPDQGEVRVSLSAEMTEVGVLKVTLNSETLDEQWVLHFGTQAKKIDDTFEQPLHQHMGQAEELLTQVFSKSGQKQSPDAIKSFKSDLEKLLGDREDWNLATSRRLSDRLLALRSGKNKSAQHERQWLQLIGFCLRPGYGAEGDADRMNKVSGLLNSSQIQFQDDAAVWGQYWTLWRRLSGGLTADQQRNLFAVFQGYFSPAGQRSRAKMKELSARAPDDLIRLMGCLERLAVDDKLTVMNWLNKRLGKSSESDTGWWSIGRLGSVQMLYGDERDKLSSIQIQPFLQSAMKEDWKKRRQAGLAAVLMAAGDAKGNKELAKLQSAVKSKLQKEKCPKHWAVRMELQQDMDKEDFNQLIGETVPIGLRLI